MINYHFFEKFKLLGSGEFNHLLLNKFGYQKFFIIVDMWYCDYYIVKAASVVNSCEGNIPPITNCYFRSSEKVVTKVHSIVYNHHILAFFKYGSFSSLINKQISSQYIRFLTFLMEWDAVESSHNSISWDKLLVFLSKSKLLRSYKFETHYRN